MVGAYLFGGVTVIQFFAQGAGVELPSEALSALPYLATVGALVLISRNAATARRDTPLSLGKPFHPSV
jgi:simple sugar transport system permease protein